MKAYSNVLKKIELAAIAATAMDFRELTATSSKSVN